MLDGRGMNVEDTVEALRRFVAGGARRGALLEEDLEPPARVLRQGYLSKDVFRRWAGARPGVAFHPEDRARVPASFAALIERYGSLHWVPPEGYDGELGWRNAGPSAFLALARSPSTDLSDYLSVLDEELVARLEAAGVEEVRVFHDGLGEFAAFDARLRGADGEPLVIEGFDEHSWIDRVLEPATTGRTFAAWLEERIAAVKASLAEAAG